MLWIAPLLAAAGTPAVPVDEIDAWTRCIGHAAAEFAKDAREPSATVAEAALGSCGESRDAALAVFDRIYRDDPERARQVKADMDDRQRRWLLSLILRLRAHSEE